jgi:hypothetical protein
MKENIMSILIDGVDIPTVSFSFNEIDRIRYCPICNKELSYGNFHLEKLYYCSPDNWRDIEDVNHNVWGATHLINMDFNFFTISRKIKDKLCIQISSSKNDDNVYKTEIYYFSIAVDCDDDKEVSLLKFDYAMDIKTAIKYLDFIYNRNVFI